MSAYVRTPESSRFGGLILPEETVSTMISAAVSDSYRSASPRNKNTINWQVSSGSADADTLPSMGVISYQARDLDRNNPLATGALDTIVDAVVATGVRPQSTIDRQILGLTEEQAAAWQTEAERYFYLWADSPDCDVTRHANFWQQQALVLINEMLSGDCFTIRRYKERPGAAFGTCAQLVEADRCETPPEKNGIDARVYGGVECDADGEPIRYHFLKEHPGDYLLRRAADVGRYTTVRAYDDAGAALCLHHFRRRRPDQRRGVSIMAPVIELFKQLGRYTEAEITAAVVQGMFSVFVKTPTVQGSGLPGTIPGQIPGGPKITPAGTGLTRLQSGMIMDLAAGEEVQFANPNRVGGTFDAFWLSIMKQIAAGLGLPLEVLIKHFTASYSASRGAMLEAWKMYRRRRAWLVASFCQPIYGWVIAECIARGHLQAPGFFEDPIRRAAWLGTMWRGAPMGQLDPLKEAKAAQTWLAIPGATTVQQITAEQFGTDYEDNLVQTSRERAQIAKLPPDPIAPPTAGQGAATDGAGNAQQLVADVVAAVESHLEDRDEQ